MDATVSTSGGSMFARRETPSSTAASSGMRTYDKSSGATQEQLLALVKRLNRALGLPPGRATDGVATASAQMLSKMVSRYEVTRVSIQQTQRTIEQHSKDYQTFRDAYADLKDDLRQGGEGQGSGSAGHLDRYLTVVARILADGDLRETLAAKEAPGMRGQIKAAETPYTGGGFDKENSESVGNTALRSPLDSAGPALSSPYKENGRPTLADTSGFALRSPYRDNMMAVDHKVHMDEISGSLASSRKKKEQEVAAAASYEDSRLLRTAAAPAPAGLGSLTGRGHYLHLGGARGGGSEGDSPALPQWALAHPVIYSGQGVQSLLVQDQAGLAAESVAIHSEISTFEPELQELMLIDDLLYVFLGSKGKLIRPRYAKESEKIDFVVDLSLDHSLRVLAEKFLPICLSLQVLQVFIETRFDYNFGLVNHALGAVTKEVVWEWRLLVSQMEQMVQDGNLSLHSMWYYCQPSVGMLKAVSDILTVVINKDLRGADVLNVIHASLQHNKGDKSKHDVVLSLMKAACRPYLRMLKGWLFEAKVEDPYCEFMVEKGGLGFQRQEGHRLRGKSGLRKKCVPHFMENATDKILRTGKLVLLAERDSAGSRSRSRGRGGEVEVAVPTAGQAKAEAEIVYDSNNRSLLDALDKAFALASARLRPVIDEVIGRLRSIKRRLDQGLDFEENPCFPDKDQAEARDQHGDTSMALEWLEANGVKKWQLIRDRLEEYRRRERSLGDKWQGHQLLRRQKMDRTDASLRENVALWTTSLQRTSDQHAFYLKLESKWKDLEEKLERAADLDEISESHEVFLDEVLR